MNSEADFHPTGIPPQKCQLLLQTPSLTEPWTVAISNNFRNFLKKTIQQSNWPGGGGAKIGKLYSTFVKQIINASEEAVLTSPLNVVFQNGHKLSPLDVIGQHVVQISFSGPIF